MFQLTPLPGSIFSCGLMKCSFPAASSAIRIMPFDSIPLIFLGARLTTTTTCRPTISSGLKCNAIPETTVLISKPRSTSSFNSLSAFSTFSALTILPTRRSSFEKSSYTISGFTSAWLIAGRSTGPDVTAAAANASAFCSFSIWALTSATARFAPCSRRAGLMRCRYSVSF